jgi:hypothetical protein
LALLCVLAAVALVIVRAQDDGVLARSAPAAAGTSSTASFAPGTTPTTLATTTTTVPPTTTTTAPPPPVHDLTPYRGLGAWIDVYDWSEAFNQGGARLSVADIDRMADEGVQTLYVQTSKSESPTDILEPNHLLPLIARAKVRHLSVVAWYLPSLENAPLDQQRLLAASRLAGVDAVAVDIESQKVDDIAERNRRILALTAGLRASISPRMALGAIVYPPIVTDVLNQNIWPSFPWHELAPSYDVWLPMNYQSFRKAESGYRDGYRYTAENVDRLRAHLGAPDVPVHVIGGIADETTAADVAGMVRAAGERRAIGGSLYDYKTTPATLWPSLRPFRR